MTHIDVPQHQSRDRRDAEDADEAAVLSSGARRLESRLSAVETDVRIRTPRGRALG